MTIISYLFVFNNSSSLFFLERNYSPNNGCGSHDGWKPQTLSLSRLIISELFTILHRINRTTNYSIYAQCPKRGKTKRPGIVCRGPAPYLIPACIFSRTDDSNVGPPEFSLWQPNGNKKTHIHPKWLGSYTRAFYRSLCLREERERGFSE